jgi:hypothetical protein
MSRRYNDPGAQPRPGDTPNVSRHSGRYGAGRRVHAKFQRPTPERSPEWFLPHRASATSRSVDVGEQRLQPKDSLRELLERSDGD